MENWQIEMERAIEAFKLFPRRAKDTVYDIEIQKYINHKWKSKVSILKLEQVINNDTPDRFHLIGIYKYNWSLDLTKKILDQKYYADDLIRDNILNTLINEKNIIKLKTLVEKYESHYNIYNNSLLYIKSIDFEGNIVQIIGKDGNQFNMKKVGITTRLNERYYENGKKIPFNIKIDRVWEIDSSQRNKVDTIIKHKIQHLHRKGEWYFDDNIENIISTELILLKKSLNCHIRERKLKYA